MMRSLKGDQSTNITFINTRSNPIHLYWRNYDGARVSYGTVAANGGRKDQQTFVTHPWVITDDNTGEVLGIWNPVEVDGRVIVN